MSVADFAGKRRHRPGGVVADRHNVGMSGKRKMRAAGAEARVKIIDVGCAGLGEYQAMTGEACRLENVLQKRQRARFVRRHALAADKRLCQGDWICRDKRHDALGL